MLRLFMKEHAAFIVFQVVLVAFIMLLYWLDGFRNLDTAIYSFVISTVLVITFLSARFARRYQYYQRILSAPQNLEHMLQREGKSPEQVQNEVYLQKLYRLYQHEVQSLYAAQNRHLQFMNQWVHQMKTPISVMHLLLQEEKELDKNSVREEMERLKAGLDTVLMNARLDTFEQDMQVEQINLRALVSEVATENKRLFISKRVYPEISIGAEHVVATDQKWMKFIIGQFLTNAVKYTFKQNKKVYIAAECSNGNTLLTIRDEGIGISSSDLPRVTKAFFTGENGRKIGESTGMGLYLAKEVCGKLGHELTISSVQGEGTTVSVLFCNQDFVTQEEHDDSSGNR
ncbi:integral membrane sensor signal transduction histidine kinase [Planococcus donghaensis MPA1U2]|uniref:histidine kinase n=1 Tax=Planococcus donghaensis MPA1U2 TaxID=933115 RepID=E7RGX9_9BACL|nr:sensor histidine kinase [Planococcus donghaensis]EGA89717.1 integral membrane sensor signal transduction histidine kinase [Planococcus donghaensis MPA1U2]